MFHSNWKCIIVILLGIRIKIIHYSSKSNLVIKKIIIK